MSVTVIRSGGQTGADRAALDFAIKHGIPYEGWVPKGGWAEDCPNPPGVLTEYPSLKEAESSTVNQRTIMNVRDSDATLVVHLENSPGTNITVDTCVSLDKNYYVYDGDTKDLKDWFNSLPNNTVLNVGGPRESERPGTYEETLALLSYCFGLGEDELMHKQVPSMGKMVSISTYTDKMSVAKDIVNAALARGVAKSAHITPVSSMYKWGGEIDEFPEHQVILICEGERHTELVDLIKELHNYTMPAITYQSLISE